MILPSSSLPRAFRESYIVPQAQTDFHFGIAESYSGTGTTVNDLIGSNVLTVNGNPVFGNEAFTLDGTDDYFEIDSNPAWLANAHKTSAGNSWWFAIAGTLGTTSATKYLMSTRNGGDDGIAIRITTSGATTGTFQFFQFGGGLNVVDTTYTIEDGSDFVLIISYDYDTQELRSSLNSNVIDKTSGFAFQTTTTDSDPLQLGAFNSGSFIHAGTEIHGFMGGSGFLDPDGFYFVNHTMQARLTDRNYLDELIILGAGQSNMEKWFTDFSGAGQTAFENVILNEYTRTHLINVATGGSSASDIGDNGYGYWYDLTNDDFGNAYQVFLDELSDTVSKHAIDWIVWIQGEADGQQVDESTYTSIQFKTACANIFEGFYRETKARVAVVPLGFDKYAVTANNYNWQRTRVAQKDATDSLPNVYYFPPYFDQEIDADGIHLVQASYETVAERTARRILAIEGKASAVGTAGPSIEYGKFIPDTRRIYLTITHDAGTDFTITEESTAWRVIVNGSTSTVTSVTKIDETTVEITVASILSVSDNVIIESYPHGAKYVTPSEMLVDNASNSMCIQPVMNLSVEDRFEDLIELQAAANVNGFDLIDLSRDTYRVDMAQDIRDAVGCQSGKEIGVQSGVTCGTIGILSPARDSTALFSSLTSISNNAISGDGTEENPYLIASEAYYDGASIDNRAVRVWDFTDEVHIKFSNCSFYDYATAVAEIDNENCYVEFENCEFSTSSVAYLISLKRGHVTLNNCMLRGTQHFAGIILTSDAGDKSLTINNMIVDNDGYSWEGQNVIWVNSGTASISHVEFDIDVDSNGDGGPTVFVFAYGDGTNTITIENCDITSCNRGIRDWTASSTTPSDKNLIIRNCRFTDLSHENIQIRHTSSCLVEYCEFYNTNIGGNSRQVEFNSLEKTRRVQNCTVQYCYFEKPVGDITGGQESCESICGENIVFTWNHSVDCCEDCFEHKDAIANVEISYTVGDNTTQQIADIPSMWDYDTWTRITDTSSADDLNGYIHHVYGNTLTDVGAIVTGVRGVYVHDIYVDTLTSGLPCFKVEDEINTGTVATRIYGAGGASLEEDLATTWFMNTSTGSDIEVSWLDDDNYQITPITLKISNTWSDAIVEVNSSNYMTYPGFGSRVNDILNDNYQGSSGNEFIGDHNYTLNGNDSNGADYPSLANDAGTTGNYFELNGNSWFEIVHDHDFIKEFHKKTSGNAGTIAVAFRTGDTIAGDIMGNAFGVAGQEGWLINIPGTGAVRFRQLAGGSATYRFPFGGEILTTNTDYILVVSWDADTNTLKGAINESTFNSTTLTFSATSADADANFTVMSGADGTTPLDNGSRFYMLLASDTLASDADLVDINEYINNFVTISYT